MIKRLSNLSVFMYCLFALVLLFGFCGCINNSVNTTKANTFDLNLGESAEVDLASDGPHLYNVTVLAITPGIIDTYGGKTKTYTKVAIKVKNCSDSSVYAGLQSKIYFENESGQMSMMSYFPHEDKAESEASTSRLAPGGEAEYNVYYEGTFKKIDLLYDKDHDVVASWNVG